jgi:hypothetical protein
VDLLEQRDIEYQLDDNDVERYPLMCFDSMPAILSEIVVVVTLARHHL